MLKHTIVAVALFAAACKGKSEDGKGASAAKAVEGDLPADIAAWMPKDAAQPWQGAWSTRLTMRTGGTISMAGDPAAVEIKGDKATAWDGGTERPLGFAISAPCTVEFSDKKPDGSTYYYHKQFVLRGGALEIGDGAVGYRRGKAAVACTTDSVFVLDDKATCTEWSKLFKWQSKPATCAWTTDGGKDVLVLGTGDWAHKLAADGDVLADDQFRESVKYTTRASSYADAKSKVTAPPAK